MTPKEPYIELPKPSSLLLKRLVDPKKNLTIRTPSYRHDYHHHLIHSAPLRKVMNKRIMKQPIVPSHIPPHTSALASSTSASSSSSSSSRKQLFLQPFEYLYDNLQQVKELKSTLDDEIRKSSNLIQTLQSSSDLIESLVRKHVNQSLNQRLEHCLNECASPIHSPTSHTSATTKKDLLVQLFDRIDVLESKLLNKSS
ncbi:hypothetical protein BCV72DRAFT_235511 [Rhizopus microsporus var. microsporus]|uniref:Uncharacterized protein n=2 Tax=Rhizopus microsporus TaxID=58291 RepID=A0A2G4SJA9_RHIZD|nr:uncharacterized protein RHIMIDRAFT_267918 [Rhizopus microsporus ATCC 52813]ORE01923.1 hypothetical protein BCV72DRAFT_235511 [Rhizopus microsporus var. microsporus]PHZ08845.1 hypothetical protein RHIMIDRAFT_267918 [Rhizopus microsporus ATCC 52813]